MGLGQARLTDREVRTLKATGRHSDGNGLYLRITKSGSRSWVFMHAVGGKRSEIGLGSQAALSLKAARELAGQMREQVAMRANPRDVIKPLTVESAQEIITFGAAAEMYITRTEAKWKNQEHRRQWRASLQLHGRPLLGVSIDQIDKQLVADTLRPIWTAKSETARRVRGRIERVIDYAVANELCPPIAINPASLKMVEPRLDVQAGRSVQHHAALPREQSAAFMAELSKREAISARCLEFTILTAARSGEALGATWAEIDLEAGLWTIPAARMKAGQEHVVPLSREAISLLERVTPDQPRPSDRVFGVAGAARSNMAMTMLLRRMKHGDITVHGFRSTFRDWAGDETDFPREVMEHALAHKIGDKAEQAYRRGNALARRRALMQAWASFLYPATDTDPAAVLARFWPSIRETLPPTLARLLALTLKKSSGVDIDVEEAAKFLKTLAPE